MREKPSFNTSSPFARWSRWHVNTFLSLIRDALNNHRTQFHQTHATSFRARSMNLVLTACSATDADCLASLWVKIVAPSWNGNVLSPPIVPLAFVSSTTPCLRVLACQVAALVISHNLTKPPASASRRFTLRSWNITSLSDFDTLQARRKIDLLQRLSSNSIIALQETGWDTTQPRALMQILGTNEIAASPAINTEGGRRSGGVAIILPTYAFGRIRKVMEIIPGYAVMVCVGPPNDPLHILNVYLRPGEQTNFLARITKKVQALLPTGRLYIGGDFNMDPSDERLQRFMRGMSAVHAIAHAGALKRYPHTFRVNSNDETIARRSSIDHWLIRDAELSAGRRAINVQIRYPRLSQAEHAIVTIIVSPVKEACQDYPEFSAVPTAAIQNRSAAQSLTRELAEISLTCDPTADIRLATATIWAWFRGYGGAYYQATLRNTWKEFFKVARATAPYVVIQRAAFESANTVIELPCKIADLPPAGENTVRISTAIAREIAQRLDMHIAISKTSQVLHQVHRSVLGKKSAPVLWKRIKAISPKFENSLQAMEDDKGRLTTEPSEISKSLLSTRGFWTTDPEPIPQDVIALINDYSKECFHFADDFRPPTKEFYKNVIINTGDSAPGIDGIPYAALRADPGLFAQILVNYTEATTLGHQGIHPGHQLLVWIAKGEGGTKADCWRPLGMPTTLMRAHSAAAYKWISQNTTDLLHPAQALVNNFREPQGNFIWMQDWLFDRQSHLNLGVALTDMVKAFELINPEYLILVLAALKAPLWLIKYATLVLFGRKVIPKIKGKLTEFFALLVGVDMGSAFSGLLFCIGLDPVIRAANRIPGVIAIRGYMDDNATALKNAEAFAKLQKIFRRFHKAGLQVKEHHCCSFLPTIRDSTTGMKGSAKNRAREPGDATHSRQTAHAQKSDSAKAGFASWRSAAKEALRRWPIAQLFDGGSERRLKAIPRGIVRQIAEGRDRRILPTLCMQPCKCGCKTFLIVTAPMKAKQLMTLDRMPWGAKVLTVSATYLGLPMKSPVAAWWMPRAARSTRSKIRSAQEIEAHKKADSGVAAISARVQNTLSPLPTRAAFASMLAQSKHYYSASVFPASATTTSRLQGAFARIILKRRWIPADKLQGLLREVGISPGPDVRTALISAYVGLRLRMKTSLEAAYQNPPRPEWKQVRAFLDEIAHHPDPLVQAQNRILLETSIANAPAEKVKSTIKMLGKHKARAIAQAAIHEAVAVIVWKPYRECGAGQIGQIKTALLPHIARIPILKWSMDREADSHWRLVISGGTRRRPTPPSREIGACHPFGMNGPTLTLGEVDFDQPLWTIMMANAHRRLPNEWQTKTIAQATEIGSTFRGWAGATQEQIGAERAPNPQWKPFFNLHASRAAYLAIHYPIFIDADENRRQGIAHFAHSAPDPCPLCGAGDASVEHWTSYCWVTNMALSIFIGKLAVTTDWEIVEKDQLRCAIVAHVTACARRRLVSLGAIGKDTCKVATGTLDVYKELMLLVSATRQNLPLLTCDEANLLCAFPISLCAEPCEENDVTNVWGKPARHLQGIRKRQQKPIVHMCATTTLCQNDTVVYKHGNDAKSIWHIDRMLPPPIPVSNPDQANCTIIHSRCCCGRERIKIKATTDIPSGAPIKVFEGATIVKESNGSAILVQFDGSCDGAGTSAAHAGAGVAVYLIADGERVLLAKERHPLPHVKSAPHAEAHGMLAACVAAIREREDRWRLGDNPKIIIQGDNATAIGYMNHESSVKAGAVQSTLREAWMHACLQLTAALIEYIPREINKAADALAVEARKIARSMMEMECPPPPEIIRVSVREIGGDYGINDPPAADAFHIVLREKPHITAEDMMLLQSDSDGPYDELLPSYLMQAHEPGGVACFVQYTAKTEGGSGRMYGTRSSAQSLSRKARTVALQKHNEYDMVAAHLAIFIAITRRTEHPIGAHPSKIKEQMIEHLRTAGATIDNATTFTRAFLNVEAGAIPGMASRIAMFAGGSPAVKMAQEILAHKERVIRVAEGDGFNREAYAGCNDRNLLYFALEFYEAKIMRALIEKVAKLGADSIAWVHDGIFVSQNITKGEVFHAFGEAVIQSIGIHTAAIQIGWTEAGLKHAQWKVEAQASKGRNPAPKQRTKRGGRVSALTAVASLSTNPKMTAEAEQTRNEATYWKRKNFLL